MQRLQLGQGEVDPAVVYAADDRSTTSGRPWLLVNMISSIDGATSVGGVSGPLGGPADRRVFSAIRAVADVILVGADTVRAEGYGPPRPSPDRQHERRARGQAPIPRVAVVSGGLDLDPASRLFSPMVEAPIVVTTANADPGRRAALRGRAEIIEAGEGRVDLELALGALAERGAGVVLAEGGPCLNGQLIAAGLVDELCLSLSPMLVAGDSQRVAHGPTGTAVAAMDLDRVLSADGLLFLRYVRPR